LNHWNYNKQRRNSNGKSRIFDYGEPESSVANKVIATMTATGNGNVAAKTGNAYISGTTTDGMTIPTTNLGFRPRSAR